MDKVFKNKRLNKAIILAGGHSASLSPLTKYGPVCTFPIMNKSIIEWTIDFLKSNGVRNIAIAGSQDSNITEYVNCLKRNNGSQVDIQYVEEDKPRGTAGILWDLSRFIKDESFLVINSSTYIRHMNLDDFFNFHKEHNSVLTVGINKIKQSFPERINTTKGGIVTDFSNIHSSRNGNFLLKPTGIYMLNPLALKYVEKKGYFDLKEQLIPALQNASLPVYSYEVKGYSRVINSIEDYFNIHRENLCNGLAKSNKMIEIAEKTWIGKSVSISPEAYLLGPVIIGNNCTIGKNAKIIGPSIIGNACNISENVLIRESILWDNLVMEKGSSASYCVIGRGLNISSGDSFNNTIIVDKLKIGDVNLIPLKYEFNWIAGATIPVKDSLKCFLFRGVKRSIDIFFSSIGLIILSPLILLISIFIKLDSEGPVIFWQKRCGKDGKDFKMLKFRTMIKGAEDIQYSLIPKKEVDGPMFKIAKDPRITRIGGFLRKSSLDELPQLINVLKGKMSLVGPRPLVMDEMKFNRSWRDIRLKIKPGITGLWQVHGRSKGPFHDWIQYDIHYVKNQSLWMDIKIMIKTISVVFTRFGAY